MKMKTTFSKQLTTLILGLMIAFGFNLQLFAQGPAGSTCENPLVVNPFSAPLVNFEINSEAYGNDYVSTMVTPASNYLNGNDIVFQFTVEAKSYIYASIQGQWAGLVFVATCPNATTPATRIAFVGGGTGGTVPTFTLDPGSYFMIAGTWPDPLFTNMVINFSAVPVPLDPTLTTNPSELNVGLASPGLHTASKTISLSNTGVADAIINDGGFVFTGTNSADYSVTLAAGDAYPLTIAFGQSKLITVHFNPAANGASTANLEITYNNPTNPIVAVPVSGTGYAPYTSFYENFDQVTPVPTGWFPDGWTNIVQSSATTANVAVRGLGSFSPPNSVRYTSGADLNATLLLVSPAVTNLSGMRVMLPARMGLSSHTGQFQVGYLTSKTDASTFVPVNTFDITGSYQLYSSDFQASGLTFPEFAYIGIKYIPLVSNRNLDIDNIVYETVPTQPIFNVNQTHFNFGSTTFINESTTQLMQIYNSGSGNLTINESDISIGGADPDVFSLIYPEGHTWPISLAFGQAINITLKFTPTEGRLFNATLNIEDNTTAKVVNTITLEGTGYDATLQPGFNFNFIGDFPPLNWRRYIGLIATGNLTPTTAAIWVHKKFANNPDLPENNSASIYLLGTGRNHWLTTPPIDLGDGSTAYQLEFDMAVTANNSQNPANFGPSQRFGVVISTDGGLTWNESNALQWWNETTPVSSVGETVIIDLSAYSGRISLGFYGESTVTGGTVNVFVSNVKVNESFNFVALPYEVDFESETFPPTDWSTYSAGAATTNWASSTVQNHTTNGTKSAYHNYGDQGVALDNYLITPALLLPPNSPIILQFWSYNIDPSFYEKNSVLISTGSGDPLDGDFIEVWTTPSVTASWTETTVDLTQYAGNFAYIAFRYQGTYAHGWFVDDVTIETNFYTSPIIEVSPLALNQTIVQDNTANKTISVKNTGIENLIYSIETTYGEGASDWITIDPTSGELVNQQTQNHVLTFNSNGLAVGVYSATVTVNSNDPENPAVAIAITMTVVEPTDVEVIIMANEYLFPVDISENGEYVAISGFGGVGAYLWSKTGGLTPVLGTNVSVHAVAEDGTIGGTFRNPDLLYNGNPIQTAGRWNPATGEWSFIGINPAVPVPNYSDYSSGWGMTSDRSMVVGMQYLSGAVYRAFKWTETGGYDMIGNLHTMGNRPNGVSNDGSIVYGWAQTASLSRSPVIWHNGQIIFIAPTQPGEASCASPDGNYAAGNVGNTQGFLWSPQNGTVLFPNTLNTGSISPVHVMDDGTVFGFTNTAFPPIPTMRRAFVRYPDGTMSDFNEYALSRGMIGADEWIFYGVHSATPDGMKMIGAARTPDNQDVSFYIDFGAEIPQIEIAPESLSETLDSGASSVQELTVSNTGSGDLNYETFINYLPSARTELKEVPQGEINNSGEIELQSVETNAVSMTESESRSTFILNYDGPNANAVGLTAGGTFYTTARFPAELVAPFEGTSISEVNVYVNSMPTAAMVKIWGPGTTTSPGLLLYEQSFTPTATAWNTINFDIPLLLDGNDIWVGVMYTHDPAVWVAGIDAGPLNPNGDFLSNDGINWERLSNYGFIGNWNIRATLQLGQGSWLTLNPASGTIVPEASEILNASFDATGLFGGEYAANIIFLSNANNKPLTFVPVDLEVNSVGPVITVAPETLSDTLEVNQTSSHIVTISNVGDLPLAYSIEVNNTANKANVGEELIVPQSNFHLPSGGDRINPLNSDVIASPKVLSASNVTMRSSFSEGFDDITTLPGLGWALVNNSSPVGTTTWFQASATAPFPAYSGAPTSYIGANFNNTAGTGTISNWLLTPETALANGNTITFWTRVPAASSWPDRLEVRLSTNGASQNVGTTATSVGDFTTLMLSVNEGLTVGGYPEVWTQFTATISGLAAPTTGRIAFRYFVTGGGPSGNNSNYIGIDSFEYTGSTVTPDEWLSAAPLSGVVAPGESAEIEVMLDATGLAAGIYAGSLAITSNDLSNPLVTVPVTLLVEAPVICFPNPRNLSSAVSGQDVTLNWQAPQLNGINAVNPVKPVEGNPVAYVFGEAAETTSIGGVALILPEGSKNMSGSTSRSLLYDNGPFINSPGTGPNGTDQSILQNTTLGMNTLGAGIQFASGNRMADDIVVDETWTVEAITVYGYQTGSPTTSSMTGGYVQIWDGDPTAGGQVIWGDIVTNRMASTAWTNSYRLSEGTPGTTRPIMSIVMETPGLVLQPGTYWIDYTLAGSLASGPWAPPITINGQAVTGNAKQFLGSSSTWQDFLDTGTGTPAQGLPFLIEGTTASGGCVHGELLGYNVYRDGVQIGNTVASVLTFMQSNVTPGDYVYGVSAVYGQPYPGESEIVTTNVSVTAPVITVTPAELYHYFFAAGDAAIKQLTLGNTGNGPLNWTASIQYVNGSGWLSFASPSGTVAPGATQVRNVSFNSTGLPIGVYSANILIASNDPATPVKTVPVVMDIAVGVDENPMSAITVYPVPARSELNINLVEGVRTVRMFNFMGQVVLESSINGESTKTFSLDGLRSGAYTLQFINADGRTFNKNIVIAK
jgi:hypothetical protein